MKHNEFLTGQIVNCPHELLAGHIYFAAIGHDQQSALFQRKFSKRKSKYLPQSPMNNPMVMT